MSFEKPEVASPDNYDWAVLGPLGAVDLVDIEESGESHFVTSQKLLQRMAKETELLDEATVGHAFRFLSDHMDLHHSGDAVMVCRCPLRGWHSSGRGILLDPDSLLATGDLLTRNLLALRMYRLWEYGAQNITETAEFLRSLGVQYGVRISPEP